MKKIILIAVFAIISCTDNSESKTNNLIPKNLIGTWKLVGYYDDLDNDPVTGTNYHLVENGDIYKFNTDGTFDNVGDTINPDGTYFVSVDSVITLNYNANSLNPNITYTNKINELSENVLKFSCNLEGALCDTYRYEKIIAP